jgi:uncharacterized membrane protein
MKPDPALDNVLAITLKIGAYSACACILAGLALHSVTNFADQLTMLGFRILLATPGLRIVVAAIQFWRKREYRYVLVSLGVLGIIGLAYVLGIQA